MEFNRNVGGGTLIDRIRFYVLAIAVGLIFSATVAVASTTISTNILTDGTLTVTGLSTFGNASSTLLSATNGLWVGSSGATSIFGSATSTFGAGISATYLHLSGTSASSTAANGINLTAGCFAMSGTCVGTVTGTWPIISLGGLLPTISFGGLSTSTAAVVGNIPYFSSVNTFANVATSSPTGTYPLQISGAGTLVGSATTFSLAFGTTTANTWSGAQTFNADVTPVGRLMLPMGEINYFDTTGTTITIASASDGSTNLVKVAPVTALSADFFEFDNGGANNGRLRYTGATTKMFHTAFTISMDASSGAGTNLYVFGITKNGIASNCKVIQSIAVSNDTQSTALHCMVSLSTNDYLELYSGNLTDGDDLIVKTLNLFAMGL